MSIIAGFVLCSSLTATCETYIDNNKYTSIQQCQQLGTKLYNELKVVATDTDVVLGDCFTLPDELDEPAVKAYVSKELEQKLKENGMSDDNRQKIRLQNKFGKAQGKAVWTTWKKEQTNKTSDK